MNDVRRFAAAAVVVILLAACGSAPTAQRSTTTVAAPTSTISASGATTAGSASGTTASGATAPVPPASTGGSPTTSTATQRAVVTIADLDLQSAQVPATCDGVPAQRLKNGQASSTSAGWGNLSTVVAYTDLAGLGYKQALTSYICGAATDSVPETLLLIGDGGRLLGSFDLGSLVDGDHATLKNVVPRGTSAKIVWTSTDGCCSNEQQYTAIATYHAGHLQLSAVETTYDPTAVADAILGAKSRSALLDPNVISVADFAQLTSTFAPSGPNPMRWPCQTSGDTATCIFDGMSAKAGGLLDAKLVLTKAPSNKYGWIVTQVAVGLHD